MALDIGNPYAAQQGHLEFCNQNMQYSGQMWDDERQEVKKHDLLFAHGGDFSMKKYITTYKQDYCQLPKLKIDGIAKKSMKPWHTENKVKSTYTKLLPKHTPNIRSLQRSPGYETETSACFKAPPKEAMLTESQRCATPRDLSVDFFKPNLSTKLHPVFAKGYPAFAVPEYTGIPPQLTKYMISDEPDAMDFRPLLPTRFVRHQVKQQ